MESTTAGDLGRHLGRVLGAGSAVGLTDAELLERFVHRRDETAEVAFEALLARHGAMVLTVCRQMLGDSHTAEDAFQATFLVTLRRAGALRVRAPGSLGPWLHGVAFRIALKARQAAARRVARERRAAVPEATMPFAVSEQGELQELLHEEINRMSAKYRAPIVLCYLEGRTQDEAAAALGWPVGTVRGRLARARNRLRERLTRRGVARGDTIGTLLGEAATRFELPARLLEETVAPAIHEAPATAAAELANLALRGLFMARLGSVSAVLAIVVMAAGLGLRGVPASPQMRRGDVARAVIAIAQPQPSSPAVEPLPERARARMGTDRLHAGSAVRQVLYAPNGPSLVTVEDDHVIRVWDAATGRLARQIGEPTTEFREMALSPDGKSLATVEQAGGLRLWDFASGRERRRWHRVNGEEYEHPCFSPDGRTISVGVQRADRAAEGNRTERFIALWDSAAPTERRRHIPMQWALLFDLEFSADGTLLATASRDAEVRDGNVLIGPAEGSARVWDLATGQEAWRFPVDRLDPLSIAFSPDRKRLAVAVTDGTVRLYDVTSGQERTMPRLSAGRGRTIGCLAFSPDGTILAGGDAYVGGSAHAAIRLWDIALGRELHSISAHQLGITSLAFAPDGKSLASTGAEPVIRLWDVATGREALPQTGHSTAIRAITVSTADGTVFTAGRDGTIRRWNPSSGREAGAVARLRGPVEGMVAAPDGKTLLVRGSMAADAPRTGWIALWSVAENRELRHLGRTGEPDLPYVAYSLDGKTVAADGRLWDATSGKVLATLRHQVPRNDRFLSFSPMHYLPDGDRVVTAEPDGLWLWQAATGKELSRIIRWSNHHCYATLSPDGRFLATSGPGDDRRAASPDWPIVVWELASGHQVATIEVRGKIPLSRPFSPDGRFLAFAAADGMTNHNATVHVWDIAVSREVRRFAGHRGAVRALAFAPDGRSVMSAGEDAMALVWDISDLSVVPEPLEPLSAEALNARWVELASDDARAAYRATWALGVPSAVAFLREHLHRSPSPGPGNMSTDLGSNTKPTDLRTTRAIAALEHAGTPAARAVLERLARGAAGTPETRDARSALDRLTRSSAR